jgi:phage tail sheath protein FI
MPTYDVPGVYIEEQTGPGVIIGVGTSTAAFIGPALRGQINEARRISNFDEFLNLYATAGPDGALFPYIMEPRPFYLAHAVRGFYENGGDQAYIVRAGTGRRASLTVNNQAGEAAFIVEAQKDGVEGNDIRIQTELTARQRVAVGDARVKATSASGATVTVYEPPGPFPFRVGDVVTEDNNALATIKQILGNVITLDPALQNLAAEQILRIANIQPSQSTFRLTDVAGLREGGTVLIRGPDATNKPVTDRAVIQSINTATGFVTLSAIPRPSNTYNLSVAGNAPILISQRIVVVDSATVTTVSGTTVRLIMPHLSGWVTLSPTTMWLVPSHRSSVTT